jgi:anti-sigma factor RsiW
MSIPEETLMAYADDELEPAQKAEVEAAIAGDPQLAARVERHRALRKKLNAAFDPILLETVPDTLVTSVRTTPATPPGVMPERGATITDLRRVRAARAAGAKESAASARRRVDTPQRPWTWFEWGAMAASIAAGAVIAHLVLRTPDVSRIGTEGGQLIAQGDLADALSAQLVSEQPADAPVQIGVSFRSKAGDTCRTFTMRETHVLGGLACREGNRWRVPVLADAPAASSAGGYKPAGGSMPAAVLKAVEEQISGEPLDAEGEAAARSRGWK